MSGPTSGTPEHASRFTVTVPTRDDARRAADPLAARGHSLVAESIATWPGDAADIVRRDAPLPARLHNLLRLIP